MTISYVLVQLTVKQDPKLYLVVRVHFWEVWCTLSLPLLQGPFLFGVVVRLKIPSMDQMFVNSLYLIRIPT